MKSVPRTTHEERNGGIDAIRGLCIVLVVLHHIGLRIPLSETPLASALPLWFLQGLNFNGAEAVTIFFVISGFFITRRSQERWGNLQDISLRDFYLLRASRIIPLLLLTVLALSVLHLMGVPKFIIHRPGQSLAGAVLSALGLYLNRYEGVHGYLPGGWDVLWSLSIEEVFYLAFPLACLLLTRVRMLVPALALLALSLPLSRNALIAGHNEIWLEKAYLPGMSAIAVGVLAALLIRRFERPGRWFITGMATVGWLGMGAVLFAGHVVWTLIHEGYGLFLAICAAATIMSAHWTEGRASAALRFGSGWLRSFGRLSYEIYLSHMFCIFGGLALLGGIDQHGRHALWYPPILVTCWLIGYCLSRWFTLPAEHRIRGRARRASGTDLALQNA